MINLIIIDIRQFSQKAYGPKNLKINNVFKLNLNISIFDNQILKSNDLCFLKIVFYVFNM